MLEDEDTVQEDDKGDYILQSQINYGMENLKNK